MNKDRLLRLADLLEADAANPNGMRFDLATVAEPTHKGSKFPAVDCGTTGCAMGLAAVSRIFKDDGLDFSFSEDLFDPDTPWIIHLSMHGDLLSYDDAAMRLFDISGLQSAKLFDPYNYGGFVTTGAEGERHVAQRIRDLVEKGSI